MSFADQQLQRIFESGPENNNFNLRWFQRTEPAATPETAKRMLVYVRKKVWQWCFLWGYVPDPATEIYRWRIGYSGTIENGVKVHEEFRGGTVTYAVCAVLDGEYRDGWDEDEDFYKPLEIERAKRMQLENKS